MWNQVWLLCAAACLVHGLVETPTFNEDPRRVARLTTFGFERGIIKLEVSNFELLVPTDYDVTKQHGFKLTFLLHRSTTDGDAFVQVSNADECFYESSAGEDDIAFTLEDRSQWERLTFEKLVDEPGFYHLYFVNCEVDTSASFRLQLTQFNADDNNMPTSYLSTGLDALPLLFSVASGAFALLLACWITTLSKQRQHAQPVHLLIVAVVGCKALSLLCESQQYLGMQRHGYMGIWNVAATVFTFLGGNCLVCVVWLQLRPLVPKLCYQMLVLVGLLAAQSMVNVALAVLNYSPRSNSGWDAWRFALIGLNLTCCAIIVALGVWSTMRRRAAALPATPLRVAPGMFLMAACAVVLAHTAAYGIGVPFRYTWIKYLLQEAVVFAFFAAAGYTLRPRAHEKVPLVLELSPNARTLLLRPLLLDSADALQPFAALPPCPPLFPAQVPAAGTH